MIPLTRIIPGIRAVSRAIALLSFLSLAIAAPAAHAQNEPSKADLLKKSQQALQEKNWAAAIEAGKQVLAMDPQNPTALHNVGYALHSQGKLDEALEVHKKLAATGDPKFAQTGAYNAACALALKGEKEASLEWLKKSIDLGFAEAATMKNDTDLALLRDDPRYAELLASISKPKGSAAKSIIFSQSTERALTRVAAFAPNFDASLGHVAIEYGPVAWKAEMDEQIKSGKLDGQRWRLGADFWTNLDASVPFSFGDQRFEPGNYYLVVQKDGEKYSLIVLSAAAIQKTKTDAFLAPKTTGGTSVAMEHSEAKEPTEELVIKLATTGQGSTAGKLTIRYGPHELSTGFKLEI